MKDTKGAEFAVRVAQEVWKGQRNQQNPSIAPPSRNSMASPSTVGRHMPPGPHPSNMHPPHGYMHPSFMGPPMMGHIGYSPMGIPAVTPHYGQHHPVDLRSQPRKQIKPPTKDSKTTEKGSKGNKRAIQEVTPQPPEIPRTLAVRAVFDISTAKKRRKGDGSLEEELNFFGPSNPKHPKTIALTIFSYLSNSDIFNASLVNKRWSKLAMDQNLWKFDAE